MNKWTYFNEQDDPLIVGLDNELMAKLDMARAKTIEFDLDHKKGVPFIITSGKRSADANSVLKGAVSDSSHITGKAVDLYVADDGAYFLMLAGLFAAGFRRIGHYFVVDEQDPNRFIPRHLHVDIDETKPTQCCFVKREQN